MALSWCGARRGSRATRGREHHDEDRAGRDDGSDPHRGPRGRGRHVDGGLPGRSDLAACASGFLWRGMLHRRWRGPRSPPPHLVRVLQWPGREHAQAWLDENAEVAEGDPCGPATYGLDRVIDVTGLGVAEFSSSRTVDGHYERRPALDRPPELVGGVQASRDSRAIRFLRGFVSCSFLVEGGGGNRFVELMQWRAPRDLQAAMNDDRFAEHVREVQRRTPSSFSTLVVSRPSRHRQAIRERALSPVRAPTGPSPHVAGRRDGRGTLTARAGRRSRRRTGMQRDGAVSHGDRVQGVGHGAELGREMGVLPLEHTAGLSEHPRDRVGQILGQVGTGEDQEIAEASVCSAGASGK